MAADKLDYKTAFKDLYLPPKKPVLIDVPAMPFIMVDGMGNPNDEGGDYQSSVELLYGLSYTIKMSKNGKQRLQGYFDYVVPPLEGLWWMDGRELDLSDKDHYSWTSMIRQPEFVTAEVFRWACAKIARKKPQLDVSKARFQTFHEGLCVQMMHIGPFEKESETMAQMENYIEGHQLRNAISTVRPDGTIKRHHEIYLSDPRKSMPEKRKTVIRHPVVPIVS